MSIKCTKSSAKKKTRVIGWYTHAVSASGTRTSGWRRATRAPSEPGTPTRLADGRPLVQRDAGAFGSVLAVAAAIVIATGALAHAAPLRVRHAYVAAPPSAGGEFG